MELQFDKYIKIIDTIFRLIGMGIESEDCDRTTFERLKHHWLCPIHLFVFIVSIIGQTIWLVLGIMSGESLLQITYLLPCITLCMLGALKTCSFIHYLHHIHDVILNLRLLENMKESNREDNSKQSWVKYLRNVYNLLFLLTALGAAAFAIGPFVIMASYYYTTGEIKLFLPFIVWYPFDAFQFKTWPFVYIHQLWGAWVAVLSVHGPDCFFFTCCTFIHVHFIYLQHDMQQVVKKDSWMMQNHYSNHVFKTEFVKLVDRHRQLIRCVELLNVVYCKSTLFNVVTSSLIICAAGFNLMAIKNYVLMAPFCCFLIFGTLQVFFYCYYGDYIMRSSAGVGDAIYDSHWYDTGAIERKYLVTVLMRCQKPCKFTAYRFADVNLKAFTRILSTSWSYFALLNQMYQN